ncbi:MAG: hypothetical protein IKS31_01520 [Clostridia bacterium]|nr:hypothetical protein [Clostridia bacterium]
MFYTLRARIVEQYGTIRAFAKAIGMHEQKAMRLVNHQRELTASEILAMSKGLNVEIPREMYSIFFDTSTKKLDGKEDQRDA